MAIGYSSNMKKSQATQESVTTSYQEEQETTSRQLAFKYSKKKKKSMHTCRKTKQKKLHHLKANLP